MTLEDARAWREAAIRDGWTITPLYHGADIDRSARLTKRGFVALIIDGSLIMWGPDGLAIEVPRQYSWIAIVAGLSVCEKCGREGKTVRLGFAGRVCPECRNRLAPKVEYRGWTA